MSYQPLFYADLERLDAMMWEEVEADQRLWEQAGELGPSPVGRWAVWHHLLPECKERWKQGDSRGLFDAIFHCGNEGIPLPVWCALAINQAVIQVDSMEVTSWDKAFSSPYKNRNLPSLKAQKDRPLIVKEMIEAIEEGMTWQAPSFLDTQ